MKVESTVVAPGIANKNLESMMKTYWRITLLAVSAVWCHCSAAYDVLQKQPGLWAQEYTKREVDPSIKFGTLPNGMRYAIRHNEQPKDGVAMRLRIGSGSLMERDNELGLAHFLEHMAFRGSTHIADGDVVRLLERQGLRFGADTNAFTSYDETVYMFNFPKADKESVTLGLNLFREIGENLLLDTKNIDVERNVVLSEERLRDSPSYRMQKSSMANIFAGTLLPNRNPIGTIESLKEATRVELARYYQANYRPDNATIIIVGNIEPAQIEAEIKAQFSDWTSHTNSDVLPKQSAKPVKAVVEFSEKGAAEGLTVSWVRAADKRAETIEVDQQDIIRQTAIQILDFRLSDFAAKPGCPYIGASISEQSDTFGLASLTNLSLTTPPDKLADSLNAAFQLQRQFAASGVTEEEIKRAVTKLKTSLDQMVARANTRTSIALAEEILQAVNADEIVQSPEQIRDFYLPIIEKVTVKQINAVIPELFKGEGPILFRSTNDTPVTESVLAKLFATALTRPLKEHQKEAAVIWPYSSFGKRGQVVKNAFDKELDAHIVNFSNGVKLIIKHTDLEKDVVRVNVNFGYGREGQSEKTIDSLWAFPWIVVGGTNKLSDNDIGRYAELNDKIINEALAVAADAFAIGGTTRPRDLDTELELLTAYVTDAGFRPELTEKLKATIPTAIKQIETNPSAVFGREFSKITTGYDRRYVDIPYADQLQNVDIDLLRSVFNDARRGPFFVTIVGDVDEKAAISAVAHTFAAIGPTLTERHGRPSRMPITPKAEPVRVIHEGRLDQAIYADIWPLPDYQTAPELNDSVKMAVAVLDQRLIDAIREKMGLTYSPSASATLARQLRGIGFFVAEIETPPENFGKFHEALVNIISELAEKPISEDELDRAKRPIVEARKKSLESNVYWLSVLSLMPRVDVVRDQILHDISSAQAVSAEDVQNVFKNYLANHSSQAIIAVNESAAH